MGVYIDDNKLVKLTEPKTICFALTNNVVNNFKQKTESFINNYEFLVENRIKNNIDQLLKNCKHGNNIQKHRK